MKTFITDSRKRDTIWMWLLMMALLYAAFFVLRYGGLWIENDTGVFSRQSFTFISHGSLFFPGAYNHGFAYTAWLGSLSLITGINPATFNTIVMPFFGMILLLIPGYLAFHALLGSRRMAAIGAVVLATIPDITFSAVRGTHEKLSMAFVSMGLFCLFKAFDAIAKRHTSREYLLWIFTYLVVEFLNVGTNDYFATTFTFAITLTLGMGFLALKMRRIPTAANMGAALRTLGLSVLASWVIVFLVMFFVYPPEAQDFLLLQGALSRLRHLFATFTPSSNPYSLASSEWASKAAFELMNIFRWLVVMLSAIMWAIDIFQVVFKRRSLDVGRLFLLGMYTAFALLVVASIPLDFTGLAAGTNLEVRNFTYVILLGSPLVARALQGVIHSRTALKVGHRTVYLRKFIRPSAIAGMCLLLLVGFLKVTLDPLVSNNWLYYTPQEAQALRFFWTHSRNQTIWSGPDDRLVFYAYSRLISNPNGNAVVGYKPKPFTEDYLDSPVVNASDTATYFPRFDYPASDRIYDDGGAQIYRMRPVSPFMH